MYNQQSPIINNMMTGNGGIYQQGYIPPNPISNVSIGGTGYNNNMNMGGYYSNVYNGFYNPYLVAQQQQAIEAQRREEQRKHSDMMKMISKNVNKALGNDIENMEQHLKQYDPVEQQAVEIDFEEQTTYRLMNIRQHGGTVNPQVAAYINGINNMYDKTREEFPSDMSMYDFNNKAGKLYMDMLIEENNRKSKQLNQLYNSEQFNQLLKMHNSGNGYFSSAFSNKPAGMDVSIDNMEVHLPSHLQNVYQQRKQAFFNEIMNK